MPGAGMLNAEEIILASLMASETEIPVFDTEGFIKRLIDAGMPEAQARIVD